MIIGVVSLVVSLTLAPMVGRWFGDRLFVNQTGNYVQYVAEIRSGAINCSHDCEGKIKLANIDPLPPHIRGVLVEKCYGVVVLVAFEMRSDVPLLHNGYLYLLDPKMSNCSATAEKVESKWGYVRPLTGGWYHYSNQPNL